MSTLPELAVDPRGEPATYKSNQQSFRPARRIGLVVLQFLMFAAAALLAIGANPLRDETSTPFDLLVSQRAWNYLQPEDRPLSTQRSDVLNATLPHWINAKQQMRSGQIPMWNPTTAGGVPHIFPSYNTLTPGFVVFALTPDDATGFLLATIFNLAMCGLGMFLLLRRHLGILASIIGALTFEFCGFNAAWLYWPHVFTLVWAPWLLLSIDVAATRPSLSSMIAVGATSALVVLGGFPFLGEIIFGAAALYWLVLLRDQRTLLPGKFTLCVALGITFGFLACLIPLAEFISWMGNFDISYRDNRGSYLGIRHADRLIPPWSYRHFRVEETMYVGVVFFILAMAALLSLIRKPRTGRRSTLVIFGTGTFLVTAALVFELVPMWMVGWFPGMYFNSWSRAIGVMDLALVCLGASFLDRLWTHARRSSSLTASMAVILLSVAQIAEIMLFFGRYNGTVPARYFYPSAPSITFMQERLGPFDHVVADRSFLSAGSLGAYGINEWFAHQYRTDGMRQVLSAMSDKPFISRTASRLDGGNIHFNAPEMSIFNVRYVAIAHRGGAFGQALRESHRTPHPRIAGPTLGQSTTIEQRFRIDTQTMLEGVSIRLATYHRKHLPGTVTVSIRQAESRTLLAESTVDAATVVDNQMSEFFLGGPVPFEPGEYLLSLAYRPGADSHGMTAWLIDEPDAVVASMAGDGLVGRLDYVLHRATPDRSSFRAVSSAAGVRVFENLDNPNGPYYIPHATHQPNRDSARLVSVEQWRPDRFTLAYHGTDPGLVVVPMKKVSGWHAEIDGRVATPSLHAGVMPAVEVTGPSTITFEYRPQWLAWIHAWLVSLGLLSLLGWWILRRK